MAEPHSFLGDNPMPMFTLVWARPTADGITEVRGQAVAARLTTIRRAVINIANERPGLVWRIHEDGPRGGWIDESADDAWRTIGPETPRGWAEILRDY